MPTSHDETNRRAADRLDPGGFALATSGPRRSGGPTLFGRNVNLIGKFLVHAVHENRSNGSYLVLSAAFDF